MCVCVWYGDPPRRRSSTHAHANTYNQTSQRIGHKASWHWKLTMKGTRTTASLAEINRSHKKTGKQLFVRFFPSSPFLFPFYFLFGGRARFPSRSAVKINIPVRDARSDRKRVPATPHVCDAAAIKCSMLSSCTRPWHSLKKRRRGPVNVLDKTRWKDDCDNKPTTNIVVLHPANTRKAFAAAFDPFAPCTILLNSQSHLFSMDHLISLFEMSSFLFLLL